MLDIAHLESDAQLDGQLETILPLGIGALFLLTGVTAQDQNGSLPKSFGQQLRRHGRPSLTLSHSLEPSGLKNYNRHR